MEQDHADDNQIIEAFIDNDLARDEEANEACWSLFSVPHEAIRALSDLEDGAFRRLAEELPESAENWSSWARLPVSVVFVAGGVCASARDALIDAGIDVVQQAPRSAQVVQELHD